MVRYGTVYLIFGQTHLSPPSNEPRGLSPRGLSHGHEEAVPVKALGVRAHETHGLSLIISHSEGFDWSCFLVGFWSCCCCGAMSCLPSKAAILLKEIDLLKKCNKFCRSANGYCLFNSFVFQICVHHFYPTRTLYSVCVCLMIALWANRNIIIIISSSIVVLLSLIIIIQLYSGSHLRHRKTR